MPRNVNVGIASDGTINILDDQGQPLAPDIVEALKKTHAPQLRESLQSLEERWGTFVSRILEIHHRTPSPQPPLRYYPRPFDVARPEREPDREPGLLGLLWPPHRRRVEEDNRLRQHTWERAERAWNEERIQHEAQEDAQARQLEEAQTTNVEAAEDLLSQRLEGIDWPRETKVAFEIAPDGASVHVDIDLPEPDDMPQQHVRLAARGLRMNIKEKSEAQLRQDYMQHVHGVVFRVVGEVYYTLPRVDEVTASAFAQRPDPATGEIRDDYLISVRCNRSEWDRTNFANLAAVDVVRTFERFELRRKVSKTGIFTSIEPFGREGTGS